MSNVRTEVICSCNTENCVLSLHDSGCSMGPGTVNTDRFSMCPQAWTRAWSWQEACWHYRNRCRRFKVIVGSGVRTAKCVHKCVSMFSNVALLDIVPCWRWVYGLWYLTLNMSVSSRCVHRCGHVRRAGGKSISTIAICTDR